MNDKLTYTCKYLLQHLKDGEYQPVPHWVRPSQMKSLLTRGYIERKEGHSIRYLCEGDVKITAKGLERISQPW